jgi:poly [ADP-ribose] polymerase 2/3/4
MSLQGPLSRDAAETEFSKKFNSKTGYKWHDRNDSSKITKKADKYELIVTTSAPKAVASTKIVPSAINSKLPIPTQEFLSMILDKDMFKSAMADLKLDMNALAKLPLGVLDVAQVARGLAILNQIETTLSPAASKGAKKKPAVAAGDLNALSSQFYTVIPHASARHIKLPVINSLQLLQEKYDMLNILGDIAIGASIDTSSSIDAKYEELNCDLDVLSRTSPEFKVIEKYIASTVGYHGIKLDNVWSLCRHPEDESFQAFSKLDNHRLLWHGTNAAVIAAIMKTGLRIMPAVSGSRVGRGIYMANELAKSAQYVRPANNIHGRQTAVFFLVEAALGKQHIIYHDDSSFVAAPPGFDSVLAKSKRSPPESGDAVLTLDKVKVKVPQLPPAEVKIDSPSSSFSNDEFLVYRENQQRLRYVVTFSYD